MLVPTAGKAVEVRGLLNTRMLVGRVGANCWKSCGGSRAVEHTHVSRSCWCQLPGKAAEVRGLLNTRKLVGRLSLPESITRALEEYDLA